MKNIMPQFNSHERHSVDILLTAGTAAALSQKDTQFCLALKISLSSTNELWIIRYEFTITIFVFMAADS